MKKIILILILIGLIVAGIFLYYTLQNQQKIKAIASFKDCVAAGYPIMESYPAQCKTPDGRSFTQEISNEVQYSGEIQIENPLSNQTISSPLTVHGKVRGNWLFEASFSGELFDATNRSLGSVILTAEGEWMTIDFVPFSGELHFSTPTTETGVLKITNANPSGLPENNKVITIPVRFK